MALCPREPESLSFLFAKWDVPWAAACLQPGSSETLLEGVGAVLGLSPKRWMELLGRVLESGLLHCLSSLVTETSLGECENKFKHRGPTPDQLDLNCWGLGGGTPGMGICFCCSYIPQVILLISQRTICYMPTS